MLKLFAVIGNPIKHSLSPRIQNAAIKAYNLNALYTKILLPCDINGEFLRDFIFSSDIYGLNITLPFKEMAINAIDSIDSLARNIGAINTLVRESDKAGNEILKGYNTDAFGFYSSIESRIIESKTRVLILGAGGSVKSIAEILHSKNISFYIANRSKEKLKYFSKMCECITFDKIDSKWIENNDFDIIVNATSSSIQGVLPLDFKILESLFKKARLIFDLMYLKQGLTPFCALAKSLNIEFLDGKNMLIFQGAFSFCYFHNIAQSEIDNIIKIMNESLI